jgi:beta-N-acetylhexosaminidase
MAKVESVEQAVGRLMSARLPSISLSQDDEKALKEGAIGGIVLFKENGTNSDQVIDLIDQVNNLSLHQPILSVDQEGGAVQRFDHFLTPIPSAMALAASGKLGTLKEIYSLNALQCRLLGFNCILAPVLDVLQNAFNPMVGTRAFSSEPNIVSDLGLSALKAISEQGLVAVAKHFPGYGDVLEDAHLDLAVNKSDAQSIWQIDLAPFRELVKDLSALMVGHVWLSALEEQPLPASISKRVTSDVLRGYLNYDGLVFTDDLYMKAVSNNWPVEEAAIMAIEAGADHLLVLGSLDEYLSVHKHLVSAVKSGRISEVRLAQSLKRLERVFGKSKPAKSKREKQASLKALAQSIADSQELVRETSSKAVTILRGEVPKITSGEWLVIVPNHARYPLRLANYLNEELSENKKGSKKFKGLRFAEVRYSVDPSTDEADQIGKECAERNCIYLTFRTLCNQGQIRLGEVICASAREHLNVACDIPYDLVGLPDWKNCLAIFDPSELAMRGLVPILLGDQKATGNCPVDLNLELSSVD